MADGFFDLASHLGLWPASPGQHTIGWGLRVGTAYYTCSASSEISVSLRAYDRRDLAEFTIVDQAGTLALTLWEEVSVWAGGKRVFAGPLIRIRMREGRGKTRQYQCSATDWGILLDKRITGTETYENVAAGGIVRALTTLYAPEIGTALVEDGSTTDLEARYDPLRDVVKEMAGIDNKVWWVDERKRLHFQSSTSSAAPFYLSSRANPDSTPGNYLLDYGDGGVLFSAANSRMMTEGDALPFLLAGYTRDGADIANDMTVVMRHDSADEQQTIAITGSAPSTGKFRLVWDGETTQEDVNEVQLLTIDGSATGLTFKLSFGGDTTDALSSSATAAQVGTALLGLDSFDPGDITATGGNLPGTPITLTFGGQYAAEDVALIRAVNSVGTPTYASYYDDEKMLELAIRTPGEATGAANIIESVKGKSALTWNAEARDVREALEGLPGVESGDIGVSGGDLPGTPIVVTFRGQFGDTDVALMTVTDNTLDDGTLTITEMVKGDPGADIVQTAAGTASQATYGGTLQAVKHYGDDRLAASDVATGLLALAQNEIEELSARVWYDGLEVGQRCRVIHDDFGIDAFYLITEIEIEAASAGRAIYGLTLSNDVPLTTFEELL